MEISVLANSPPVRPPWAKVASPFEQGLYQDSLSANWILRVLPALLNCPKLELETVRHASPVAVRNGTLKIL